MPAARYSQRWPFLVCIPADREGDVREIIPFAPSRFTNCLGGGKVADGTYSQGGVFSMHTSREERERAGLFHFVLQASASHELDG